MSRAPRERRAPSAAAQAAAGAGLGLAVVLLWPAFDSSPREMPLGAPAASVLAVPRPERLGQEPHLSVWSTVRRAVRARSAPERAAPVVASVGTRTPEGTDNTLLILDRAADRHGRVWVRARLPATSGWHNGLAAAGCDRRLPSRPDPTRGRSAPPACDAAARRPPVRFGPPWRSGSRGGRRRVAGSTSATSSSATEAASTGRSPSARAPARTC